MLTILWRGGGSALGERACSISSSLNLSRIMDMCSLSRRKYMYNIIVLGGKPLTYYKTTTDVSNSKYHSIHVRT